MKKKRENIQNEIISSEELYIKSLEILFEIELKIFKDEILTKKEIDLIFEDCKDY